MKVLEIQNLSARFDQTAVLKSLDLAVDENEIICLLGASGCGKTTLLKAIAGLLPISEGAIHLGGQDLSQKAVEDRHIGLIFSGLCVVSAFNSAGKYPIRLNQIIQRRTKCHLWADAVGSEAMWLRRALSALTFGWSATACSDCKSLGM